MATFAFSPAFLKSSRTLRAQDEGSATGMATIPWRIDQLDDAPGAWTYDAMNRITGQTDGCVMAFAGTVQESAAVTVSEPACHC